MLSSVSEWFFICSGGTICYLLYRLRYMCDQYGVLLAKERKALLEEQIQRIACERRLKTQEASLRREWAARASAPHTQVNRRGSCVVCLARTHTLHACVPCGHACLCTACARALATHRRCPMCRKQCTQFIQLYEVQGDDDDDDDNNDVVGDDELGQAELDAINERPSRRRLRQRFLKMVKGR